MKPGFHRFGLMLACSVLLTSAGCAKLDLQTSKLPWSKKATSKYATPERVIAVWTDTVYQHAGKPPTRGFGGRVYFYGTEGNVIPVDGDLVVYAYDDNTTQPGTDKPARKYVFTADQLTKYYSESDLGASYNIWIPWDAVGNDEKQISLFTVFVDKSGRMVRGNFTANRLPGRRVPTEEERRGFYVSPNRDPGPTAPAPVQQVQYTAQIDPYAADQPDSGLKTTTIRIPRTLAERMAATRPILLDAQGRTMQAEEVPSWSLPENNGNNAPAPAPSERLQPTLPQVSPTVPANYQPAPTGYQHAPAGHTSTGGIPTAPHRQAAPASFPQVTYDNGQTIVGNPSQRALVGTSPQHSVSATAHAWAREHEQSARFAQPRFRVPTKPGAPRYRGRDPIQPSPIIPPPDLPSSN